VALRGFNLSGAAKNLGTPFSSKLAPDLVARAASFLPDLGGDGFDLLRIPVVWEFLQPEPDGPLTPVAEEIRDVVEYAGRLGFRVLIDIHQDVLGSYFRDPASGRAEFHGDGLPRWVIERACAPGAIVPPAWVDHPEPAVVHDWAFNYKFNGPMRKAMAGLGQPAVLAAFRQFGEKLAATFAGLDNVLAYEVLNEPFSECFDAQVHAALSRNVGSGLGSAVASGKTPTWSVMPAGDWLDGPGFVVPEIDIDAESIRKRTSLPRGALAPSFGDGFWLVTPHFYDPRAVPLPLLAPQPDRYERVVQAAEALFSEWDVVPVVGEFGVASERSERNKCHQRWIDVFESRGWSWCLWNFNPDATHGGDDHWCGERYSVAETEDDGTVVRSDAYRALLRPFPRRYAGPLLSTSWDGRRYRASIGAPYRPGWATEIFVPSGLGGFTARGDCTVEGRTVRVDGRGGPAAVEIEVTGS
jgi:hypothetical protein